MAELVQNSLEAECREVEFREFASVVWPACGLRNLSPKERLQLMTQGQYGIGLLGFWSLGERPEMCSSVPSQAAHKLVLHRDDSNYEKARR